MDVVQAIMDLTDGYGCDIYIEATGHPASVVQGMQMIRKLGTFVWSSRCSRSPRRWTGPSSETQRSWTCCGSHISPYTYPFVIEGMADGALKTNGVVTKMFSLDQWEDAFHYAAAKEGDIKVAFRFGD